VGLVRLEGRRGVDWDEEEWNEGRVEREEGIKSDMDFNCNCSCISPL